MGTWRHDVLQCCWDANSCIVSHVLPCAQYSVNQRELNPEGSLCSACLVCAVCFAASPCLIADQRESVRKRDSIAGTYCEDCIVSTFCPCCALGQIFNQLHDDESPPQQQRMPIS